MTNNDILRKVDHTILKPVSTWQDVKSVCEEAVENRTASVCLAPFYVKQAKEMFGDKLTICTVIGFPLGYNTTQVKVFETEQAIQNGANEIDMVIHIGKAKEGDFTYIENEIKAVKQACGDKLLKVIIETCYLTQEEKIKCCKAVTNACADYIKTSTGFGTDGATVEDIKLFKQHVGPSIKIKAAGGIKTIADMEQFIELGCDRLGTSSAIKLIHGEKSETY